MNDRMMTFVCYWCVVSEYLKQTKNVLRKSLKMDLIEACRSCMKKIYRKSKKTDNPKTLEMFCHCLNISDEDNLPKQFCSVCIGKIESAYAFITAARKVDVNLRNILSRVETRIIVEPEHKNDAGNNEIKVEFQEISLGSSIKAEEKQKDTEDDIALHTEGSNLKLNSANDFNENFQPMKAEHGIDSYEDDINNESDDRTIEYNNDIASKDIDKKKIECVICFKKFGSKLWFIKHMKNEHRKKNYNCKFCPKTFHTQSKCKDHLSTHSTVRNFSCDECGRHYKTRKLLTEHMRSHSECRPFVCEICSKSYKKKSILLYHMQFHSERRFLCSVCGKDFIKKPNLLTHMRIHTGEKPYKCKDCPKAFNTSSSLRRHERMHRGVLLYSCDTCNQRFTSLGSLKRHTLKHTGELPFLCPWCPSMFADSWKRKTHIMRAHNMSLAEIPRLTRDGASTAPFGRPPSHNID